MKISGKIVMRGATYGRVSDQDSASKDIGSLESQKNLAIEQAQLLTETTGITHKILYTLIEDTGVSGGTTNRPKYQQLLDLIRSRKIDFLLAKEVSRLNRSTQDFCELMQLCRDHGVAVHIRGLSVDPNNPMSGALFQILAVIAELERNIIRERTGSSIRSAALNNKKIHGGQILLGFDRDPNKIGFWIPNKSELDQVVFLMRYFNESMSYKATVDAAKKNGIKNKTGGDIDRSALIRLLTNKKFIGKMRVPDDSKEIWVDLPFGAVIPIELFEETQRNIAKITEQFGRHNRQAKTIYTLTGILRHEDGSLFSGAFGRGRSGDQFFYYVNKNQHLYIKAPELESAVFKVLRVFENDEKMIAYANEIKQNTFSRVEFVERQVQDVRRSIQKLNEEETGLAKQLGLMDGSGGKVFSWLEKQLEGIETRRAAFMQTLEDLEFERDGLTAVSLEARQLKKSLKVVFDRLEKSDRLVQRGILRQLIETITVHTGNKIEIKWRVPACDAGGRRFGLELEWGE